MGQGPERGIKSNRVQETLWWSVAETRPFCQPGSLPLAPGNEKRCALHEAPRGAGALLVLHQGSNCLPLPTPDHWSPGTCSV